MKSVVRLSAVFAFLAIGFAALAFTFNAHADDLSPKYTAPAVQSSDAKPVNPADAPAPKAKPRSSSPAFMATSATIM